jgi:hypothetical protein
MADFVESAKNFVSSAVSRTSWEAQKQVRLRGKQGEIDKLVDRRRKLLDDLGNQVMTLYQQGMLSDSQLSRICAEILTVDQGLREQEEQLKEIKKEAYQSEQPAAAPFPPPNADFPPPAYTPPTAQPQQPRPAGSPPPQTLAVCPTCGSPIRPNALYCRSCGAKLR